MYCPPGWVGAELDCCLLRRNKWNKSSQHGVKQVIWILGISPCYFYHLSSCHSKLNICCCVFFQDVFRPACFRKCCDCTRSPWYVQAIVWTILQILNSVQLILIIDLLVWCLLLAGFNKTTGQILDCTNDFFEWMSCEFEAQNCTQYNLTLGLPKYEWVVFI